DHHDRISFVASSCRSCGAGFYARSASGRGMARYELCESALGGRLCAKDKRENRARPGKSALPSHGARGRLSLRGAEVRSRIFLKLTLAALVLITVATIIIDFAVRRAWEDSLRNEIQHSLTQKVSLFANQVQDVGNPNLATLVAETAKAADARVTV